MLPNIKRVFGARAAYRLESLGFLKLLDTCRKADKDNLLLGLDKKNACLF